MNSINRFIGLRPPQLPDTQETQDKSVQSSSSPGSSGIAGTPDIYESSQQSDPVLSAMTTRMDAQNNENMAPSTQGESVDASLVFDLLSSDSVAGIPSTPPDLSGLTQPIDGKRETYSSVDAAFGDVAVKSPGDLVDKDSLTAPDGDFVEMYLGWEQIPMDRQRGAGNAQEDEGIIRIKDRIRQAGEDKKSEDQKNADETQSQADADQDYTDKQLPDPPKWNDNPSPDGIGGGPAWMGNPEAQRYIHIPGLNGHSNSPGNPSPDGGGEEPTTPGPKKTHGGSGDGDDESSSGASGSDAGNYPFVGEEGTIIHPQVNVGSESVVTSVSSDVIQAAYQPNPDDPDGHTPQS